MRKIYRWKGKSIFVFLLRLPLPFSSGLLPLREFVPVSRLTPRGISSFYASSLHRLEWPDMPPSPACACLLPCSASSDSIRSVSRHLSLRVCLCGLDLCAFKKSSLDSSEFPLPLTCPCYPDRLALAKGDPHSLVSSRWNLVDFRRCDC